MKKVININFQGTIVPIEESSYELLQQYIDSLRRYFANEESSEEIVNDIESRISELFNLRLKAGSTCITDEDVNAIIKSIGRPTDFEENEPLNETDFKSTESSTGEQPFTGKTYWNKSLYRDENNKVLGGVCSGVAAYFNIDPVIVRILFIVFGITGVGILLYVLMWIFVPGSISLQNGVRKRLYRNTEDKILGGVCGGLGSYFNIAPWIFRILFVLPLFTFFHWWGFFGISFGPSTFIIYIILWLVIPEAVTTSEKLEMKGEKVDLNSIKNSVLAEVKSVGERVGKLGAEAGSVAAEKGSQLGKDIHQATVRTGGRLGNIVIILFKIVLYFILGCIALALIIAVFSLAVAAVSVFPLKNFILADGLQNVLAWGTLILFVFVPVVGIITFIIRRLARVKTTNKMMRYSFGMLWLLGIVCAIWLTVSVIRDFQVLNTFEEEVVTLPSPLVHKLNVKPTRNIDIRRGRWLTSEPFNSFGFAEETAYVANVSIRIKKSTTDSLRVTVLKVANGSSRREADGNARAITFNIQQMDSILLIDPAIPISRSEKFRNQNVEVTIYLPVGHEIVIDNGFNRGFRFMVGNRWNDDDWFFDGREYDYSYGDTYVMKEDGLYNLSDEGRNRDNGSGWNDDNDGPSGTYRYNGSGLDSLKQEQERKIIDMQRAMDSVKAEQDRQVEKIKDSLRRAKEEIDQKIERLNATNVSYSLDVVEKVQPFFMRL